MIVYLADNPIQEIEVQAEQIQFENAGLIQFESEDHEILVGFKTRVNAAIKHQQACVAKILQVAADAQQSCRQVMREQDKVGV